MDATVVLELDQDPPDGLHVMVAIEDGHNVVGPVTAPGSGVTVTLEVAAV
jgi:hypothetical protein